MASCSRFEESHGYLKGTHARDKDAAVAALLFAELAATVKDRKQTVLEYLDDLFIDVGHHGDKLINKVLEGREGLARINQLMAAFTKPSAPPDRRPRASPRCATTRPTRFAHLMSLRRPRPLPQPSRRPAHLSHRAARYSFRRAAVRHRAEDQVLSLRQDATWPVPTTWKPRSWKPAAYSIG